MDTQSRSAPSNLGSARSRRRASSSRLRRSTSKSSFSPCRCTFTANVRPPAVATCTWPREAAASGVRSKVSKSSERGFPKSSSMMRTAASPPNPGTSSCRLASTVMYSLGRMSMRVDSSWPSLMKVGPRHSSPSLRNSAVEVRAALSSAGSSSFFSFAWRRANLRAKSQISAVRTRARLAPRRRHPPSIAAADPAAASLPFFAVAASANSEPDVLAGSLLSSRSAAAARSRSLLAPRRTISRLRPVSFSAGCFFWEFSPFKLVVIAGEGCKGAVVEDPLCSDNSASIMVDLRAILCSCHRVLGARTLLCDV
mmetsp:Transcript_2128/g.3465  ORF Transcript_2128/g.3465 Transcript_2128/m.3465 type:complete len:311 (+) Transcript_2128:351-1283(+)